ncbi:MAG TPA: hypothetical protein VGL53_08985 [Bryobacteraceae bacterium]
MVLAINAKEIAATLPAFLLLYEILFHPRFYANWLRKHASWSLIALAIAALAMYGKMHGADPMTQNAQYRPIFTLARWLEANAAYTGLIFYQPQMPQWMAVCIWIAMAVVAWISKSRAMAWALGFVLLATFPISFIPKRLGGSLYLPLAGWAIWFAVFFDWLIARMPPRWILRCAATVVIALAFSWWTGREIRGKGQEWRVAQATTNQVLSMLEHFDYRPPHGKHILFVGSPYKDVFDLLFLANLVWNDHTLNIEDANMARDHGADHSRFDIVIAFDDSGGGLTLLKPRHPSVPPPTRGTF